MRNLTSEEMRIEQRKTSGEKERKRERERKGGEVNHSNRQEEQPPSEV